MRDIKRNRYSRDWVKINALGHLEVRRGHLEAGSPEIHLMKIPARLTKSGFSLNLGDKQPCARFVSFKCGSAPPLPPQLINIHLNSCLKLPGSRLMDICI